MLSSLLLHSNSWINDPLIELQILVYTVENIQSFETILRVDHWASRGIGGSWSRELSSSVHYIHPQIQLLSQRQNLCILLIFEI